MTNFAIQPVIKDMVTENQIIIFQKNDSFSKNVLSSVNWTEDWTNWIISCFELSIFFKELFQPFWHLKTIKRKTKKLLENMICNAIVNIQNTLVKLRCIQFLIQSKYKFLGARWYIRLNFVQQFQTKTWCSKTIKSWNVRLRFSLTNEVNQNPKQGPNYVPIMSGLTEPNNLT